MRIDVRRNYKLTCCVAQERDLQRTVGEMQQQMESTESELETCKGRLAEMQVRLGEG